MNTDTARQIEYFECPLCHKPYTLEEAEACDHQCNCQDKKPKRDLKAERELEKKIMRQKPLVDTFDKNYEAQEKYLKKRRPLWNRFTDERVSIKKGYGYRRA